jgi:hypothetical protein
LADHGSPLVRSRSSSIQHGRDSIATIEGHEAAKFVRAAGAMLWGKVYSTALILQRAARAGF